MDNIDKKLDNLKVSIVIPSCNQAKYLPETLDSVLEQSYKDWECIIVDDGSSDNTADIVRLYCDKDNRFKYIRQNNQGPSAARNKGIKFSSGGYILPLDSDDLISKDYLSEAINIFTENSEIKLVYCEAEFFGEKKGKWDLPEYSYDEILFGNMIFCSAMYRREDYNRTNGYNLNMKEGYEDWDFWLSFLNKDNVVYRIPKVHFYYRIKKTSRDAQANKKENIEKLYKQIYENHKDLYENLINPVFSEYKFKKSKLEVENLKREIQHIKTSVFWKMRNVLLKIKR